MSETIAKEKQKPFLSAWRERLQALKNVPPVLRIVWDSGPWVVALGLFFRILISLVAAAAPKVAGLIIDNIAGTVQHKQPASTQLWWLVAVEFALVMASNIFGRIIDYYDRVLADRYTRHVSIQVMEHASALDLQAYENPVFYDRLERARVQATDRLA